MHSRSLRRLGHLAAWLMLAASVAAAWFLGQAQPQPQSAPPTAQSLPAQSPSPSLSPQPQELAGVWVPYMALTADGTQEGFQANFRSIADSAKSKGLNALFVHVRPFCDALYPSQLYPWSHLLTGEQGKDPGFDPLAFMVDYAHSQGLEFHAWINPLRVKTAQTPAALAPENPYTRLKDDYPYYFMEWEGALYLNPAYPYVRTLIAQGAAEIVENYPVDGVHFDDYFYPAQDESLDREAYDLHLRSVETPLALDDWRSANIDAMVAEVYARIKAGNPQAVFGISPQGNLENDAQMGADVAAWCAVPGYLDYVCPQLYYGFDNPVLTYTEALEDWTALTRHKDLKLYAGLALYKAGSGEEEGAWDQADLLSRQIVAARKADCGGIVLYSSAYLDADGTREALSQAVETLAGAEEAFHAPGNAHGEGIDTKNGAAKAAAP